MTPFGRSSVKVTLPFQNLRGGSYLMPVNNTIILSVSGLSFVFYYYVDEKNRPFLAIMSLSATVNNSKNILYIK